jgi:hypothetical protein
MLLLLWVGNPSAAQDLEQFEIEAPPELAAEAARLRGMDAIDLRAFRDLLGLGGGWEPMTVILAPESSDIARHVPRWIAGFARGDEGVIVLFPARVPSYPHSSLTELLRHEMAHILIDRASAGASVPRWFHEGLALLAEAGWRMSDRSRLAIAVLRSGEPDLEGLSGLFHAGEPRVSWAYAVSGAFVRDIVRHHESDAIPEIFGRLRDGGEFEDAFAAVIGSSPASELRSFWRRSRFWYRWVPVISSSTVLWIAITLLALLAIRRRRQRDREMLEQWEVEESRRLLPSDESGDVVH